MNKILMDEPHIAEMYRNRWVAQNIKDMKENPKTISNFNSVSALRRAKKERSEASTIEMTEKAKFVNRLLKKKMTHNEISEILGITIKGVSDMKRRYDMPRNEEE